MASEPAIPRQLSLGSSIASERDLHAILVCWPSQMKLSSQKQERRDSKNDHWSSRLLMKMPGMPLAKKASSHQHSQTPFSKTQSSHLHLPMPMAMTQASYQHLQMPLATTPQSSHQHLEPSGMHLALSQPHCSHIHKRWKPRLESGSHLASLQEYLEPPQRQTTPEPEEIKRFIFGETDYLRDKLGFCMPSVEQTLASQAFQKEAESGQLGMQHISRQRLLTIKSLLLEKAIAKRHQHFMQRRDKKLQRIKSTTTGKEQKGAKKGASEAQQYIVLMDANTRRAKHVDDRSKFALSQEMCHLETKRLSLDMSSDMDLQVLMSTKSYLEAEREKHRQELIQKQSKIRAPKLTQCSEESENSLFNW